MKPNALAWLALYGWPLVTLCVFALRRSTARPARTTAWMLLLPLMFLPAGIELPFAGLDKNRIAVLSVSAALFLFHRRQLHLTGGWGRFTAGMVVVLCVGGLLTLRSNTDPLRFGVLHLPALGTRDLARTLYEPVVEFILPFAIGQCVFKTERDVHDLLEVLSVCVLVYAPLCLVEMRLSPQLSNWVYGYFPHSFGQMIRDGGFRPIVFMTHALAVAMFLFSGLCAALTLRSVSVRARPAYTVRAAVALVILLLARNLAAVIYSGVAILLHLWTSSRTKARVVLAISAVVLAYPTLRATGSMPTADIAAFFRQISPERTLSLQFRFTNEDALLSRALERPLFGWGGWGRARVYRTWGEPGDPWAGAKDVSTTDGSWIIWLGINGLVGLAARFALLVAPLLGFAWSRRRLSRTAQALGAGLAVLIALSTVDLLPNSLWTALPLVYAGALVSISTPRRATSRRGAPTPAPAADRRAGPDPSGAAARTT